MGTRASGSRPSEAGSVRRICVSKPAKEDRLPFSLGRRHVQGLSCRPAWIRALGGSHLGHMNVSAAMPSSVSKGYSFGGKRWKRGGMYHLRARPQRVVTHQQSGAQLQVQLNGLWIFSRRVRPITVILVTVCGQGAADQPVEPDQPRPQTGPASRRPGRAHCIVRRIWARYASDGRGDACVHPWYGACRRGARRVDPRLAARRRPSRPPPRPRIRRQVALARCHTRRPIHWTVRLLPMGRVEAGPGMSLADGMPAGSHFGHTARRARQGYVTDPGSCREFPMGPPGFEPGTNGL